MGWIDAGPLSQLDGAGMLECELAGKAILLVQTADAIYAVSATCPHQNAWFSQGRIEGAKIFCPRHFGAFDLHTGRRLAGPQCKDLAVYPVQVAAGRLLVALG